MLVAVGVHIKATMHMRTGTQTKIKIYKYRIRPQTNQCRYFIRRLFALNIFCLHVANAFRVVCEYFVIITIFLCKYVHFLLLKILRRLLLHVNINQSRY